jgi:hypothetical protein
VSALSATHVTCCVALLMALDPQSAHAEADASKSSGDESTISLEPDFKHVDLIGLDPQETPPTTFEKGGSDQQPVIVEKSSRKRHASESLSVESAVADEDPFPDVVLVGDEQSYWCSGVLLDPTHVLTAEHCAHATRVGFGSTATNAVATSVVATRRHPSLDVAVLQLRAKAVVRMHARRTGSDAAPPLGRVRILGFGVRDHIRLTGFGTKRQLDIDVNGWGCDRKRERDVGCVIQSELVIRGGRGNDTCLGDSGGPVFEVHEDIWRLVAITSRGMRPRKVICGEGGIYVRVDRIDAWLKERK